jgi:hypothetical protein
LRNCGHPHQRYDFGVHFISPGRASALVRLVEVCYQPIINADDHWSGAIGVAHDLNNILSGIVSYPQLLLMDLNKDSPLRRPLDIIKKAGENAA